MKVKPAHRKKLKYYLDNFYKHYPNEKYTILHFVKYLKKRLRINKDAWFGVSGDTGSGKSLFVIMTQILFGRPFDLTKNVTYLPKGEEIIEKFRNLDFNTLLIDEAAREMRSVNWHSKAQQKVNVAAMTERYKNNAVFLNMPNFNEFTKSMRSGNIIFRAVVAYRTDLYARIFIYRKSRNWRSSDPWADKIANSRYEALEKRRMEIDNNKITEIERGLPNTIMDFIIPNLELILPDVTDRYEELKLSSREIADEEDERDKSSQTTIWKTKYQKLLARATKALYYNEVGHGEVKVTYKDAADSLGVSSDTFSKYLKKPDEEFESKNPRKKWQ